MQRGSARIAAAVVGSVVLGLLQPGSARGAEPHAGANGAAQVLAQLAEVAKDERITRSWLSLGSGAALTTAGLLDEADGDAGFSRVVWIAGLLSIAGGTLGLLVQTPLERLEQEAGAGSAGYSPSRLQERWREQAEEARTARNVISVVHFVIAGAGLGASGALVAGLGDWGESKRESWAVQLFAGGAIFTSAGITTLLLRSDTERGYELAYPAQPSSGVTLHFAPVRGGATLQLGGAF